LVVSGLSGTKNGRSIFSGQAVELSREDT